MSLSEAYLTDAVPEVSSTVLSLLLMYYMTELSQPTTQPYISQVFIGVLSQLPWEQMKPDPQLLKIMAEVICWLYLLNYRL